MNSNIEEKVPQGSFETSGCQFQDGCLKKLGQGLQRGTSTIVAVVEHRWLRWHLADGPPGHDPQGVYGMLEPSAICLADHTDAVVALLQEEASIRNVVCMRTMEVEAHKDAVPRLPATEATDDIPQSLPALRNCEAGRSSVWTYSRDAIPIQHRGRRA